jgi:hypothetical protein
MKNFAKTFAGVVAGIALAAGLAYAVTPTAYTAGFRQEGNANGLNGLVVSGPTAPVTTGSTCASGTLTVTGGATAGQVATTTCTTLVLVLTGSVSSLVVSSGLNDGKNATNSSTPPNGAVCLAFDETHYAAIGGTYAATATSYTCTYASATITASDVIKYVILGY